MYDWFIQNIGTVIISLVLIAAIVGIVIHLHRQKKSGGCSCGCSSSSCGECPFKNKDGKK